VKRSTNLSQASWSALLLVVLIAAVGCFGQKACAQGGASKNSAKTAKPRAAPSKPIEPANCPDGWPRVEAGQLKSTITCQSPSGNKIPIQPRPFPLTIVSSRQAVEPSRDLPAAEWKSPYCRTWDDGCDACQRASDGSQSTGDVTCVSLNSFLKFGTYPLPPAQPQKAS
jgi:hypothetical protein